MPEAMPALALLIAKHKKPKGKMDEEAPMPEMAEGEDSPDIHEAIAESILKAFDDHDAKELAKSLKDFVQLCHEPEGMEESKDEGY